MPITGILSAIQMITSLVGQVQSIGQLISTAQAQNRDITAAELDALVAADDAARKALQDAIAAARAAGG